jgi:diguanylate cyclase (GGDEF)-like protein
MVAHTYDVIGRIERIDALLLHGVSSQRSHLLTGEPGYLQDFESARPAIRREIASLAATVDDNPAQAGRVADLGGLIEQRLDSAREGIRIFRDAGLPAAQAYTRDNRGLDLMAQIDALTAEMIAAERALLSGRSRASERSGWLLLGLGALGIPLSMLVLGWIYVLLSREVRERRQAEDTAHAGNLELAEAVQRLERASGDLRELRHYGELLQSCKDVPEALAISQRHLESLLADCAGTIYLLRASQDYVEAEASWGEPSIQPHALLEPTECWALRRGQPHQVADVHDGMTCRHYDAPTADGPVASACIPLAAQGITLGFIHVSCPRRGPLERMDVATTAAEQLSLALGNLRLQETLRQQSIRDALTGLYNRRYLEESLPRELSRCSRRAMPLALIMLDIDHFKAFNDRHGHEGGDVLLAAFGQMLLARCRAEDIACRFGGEEFTLILPETDLDTARRRAEELRSAAAALSVRHAQQELPRITISLGIAMAPEHADGAESLKRLADEALYLAKRTGRNRVEVAKRPERTT